MAVRETINEHPLWVGAITGVVALAFLIPAALKRHAQTGGAVVESRAFYSDDDGATTFIDDLPKVYPFDHNGRPAYRAFVFAGSDGKAFVGYLERLTPEGQRQLSAVLNSPSARTAMSGIVEREGEVKAPNEAAAAWEPVSSPQGNRILSLQDDSHLSQAPTPISP